MSFFKSYFFKRVTFCNVFKSLQNYRVLKKRTDTKLEMNGTEKRNSRVRAYIKYKLQGKYKI